MPFDLSYSAPDVYSLRSVPQFGRAGPASANTGPPNTVQIMIATAKPAASGVRHAKSRLVVAVGFNIC
jgi:hypothetical protein